MSSRFFSSCLLVPLFACTEVTDEPAAKDDSFTEIAAGDKYLCAVRGGEVVCWVSDPTGLFESPSPFKVGGFDAPVHKLAARFDRFCATTEPGEVYCWSMTSLRKGQLPTPERVAGLKNVERVVVGSTHACALRQGKVLCWGGNEFFQLGDDQQESSDTPLEVAEITKATALFVGFDMTCAIEESQARCWGKRAWLGDRPPSAELLTVNTGDGAHPDAPRDAVFVSTIDSTLNVVRSDGSVWCYGNDGYGLCAERIEGPVRELVTTSGFVCALTETNHVICRGSASDNTQIDLEDVSALTATPASLSMTACAVHGQRKHVSCWRDGSESERRPPVEIALDVE